MTTPGHPASQLPPSSIPPARVPTSIMVATGRDEYGTLVIVIVDTPTGRTHIHVDVDQGELLIEGLTNAVRQLKTGLVIAHAPGNGKPVHDGRTTLPPGPSAPLPGLPPRDAR